jgi:hypothetical protein
MNSLEIYEKLTGDDMSKKNFVNVLARDELPLKIKWPSSFVINTDKSSKPGEHWLAMYYDKNGTCEFFDPLGFSPKYYDLNEYLKASSHEYYYNSQQIQGLFSHYCGYYCTLFIMVKSRNFNLKYFLKLFSKNTQTNDLIIRELLNENFF